jgi:transketolase
MPNDIKEATPDQFAHIQKVARGIRRRALQLTLRKDGCYLSQALSSADILATLYTHLMSLGPSLAPRIPPPFPGVPRPGHHYLGADYNGERTPERDRLLLSAAHYAVAVYATLVETGRMDAAGLEQFNTDGSTVEMIGAEHSPGMELTTGSFGQALSQAGGIALARKLRRETGRVWVFMSDGECEEGQTYEALQAAAFYKLDNITVLVDVNGMQVDGATKDVIGIEPLPDRFRAFGAHVEVVDGHNIEAIITAANVPHPGKPLVLLCYTNSAQGVPLLEPRKPHIHYIRFKNEADKAQFAAFAATM